MHVYGIGYSLFSYLNRIHIATFLPFIAYNTDNQLVIDTYIVFPSGKNPLSGDNKWNGHSFIQNGNRRLLHLLSEYAFTRQWSFLPQPALLAERKMERIGWGKAAVWMEPCKCIYAPNRMPLPFFSVYYRRTCQIFHYFCTIWKSIFKKNVAIVSPTS